MKVYVIMKGEYSDRECIGVCSTEEKAKQAVIANTDWWGTPYYYEYELDEVASYFTPDKVAYVVNFDKEGVGKAKQVFIHEPDKLLNGNVDYDVLQEVDVYIFDERLSDHVALYDEDTYIVFNPDMGKAVKIASEQRAMYIAREKGL